MKHISFWVSISRILRYFPLINWWVLWLFLVINWSKSWQFFSAIDWQKLWVFIQQPINKFWLFFLNTTDWRILQFFPWLTEEFCTIFSWQIEELKFFFKPNEWRIFCYSPPPPEYQLINFRIFFQGSTEQFCTFFPDDWTTKFANFTTISWEISEYSPSAKKVNFAVFYWDLLLKLTFSHHMVDG